MAKPAAARVAARTAAPLSAAAAALCLLAAMTGQAVAAPADGGRDVPAYETDADAEQIKGTAGSGDAPEIRPGSYTDTIGRGDKRYYRVDLDAKSSAFISAVAAPKPGARVKGVGEGLKIQLESVDGSTCDGSAEPQFAADNEAHPIADYATRIIGADDECQKAGSYLFSVERESPANSDPARWPLEIRYMSEPGLKGGPGAAPPAPEESPGSAEETPAPVTAGESRKAHGGNGFSDAGALAKGVWKDRIRPGETRFYRVPVDWGQRLNAAVELGSASSPGEYPPTIYDGFGVTAYNPARGQFDNPSFVSYSPDKSAQAGVYTPPVDFASRFAYSGSEPCVAGWHYLAVRVSPQLAKYFKSTAPLTLRIDVIGKAEKGPDYAGDAQAAGFGVGEDDREQAEKGQSAAEAERSDTLRIVAYAGIGAGVLLILVLAAWTLVARRRAGAGPGPGSEGGVFGGGAGATGGLLGGTGAPGGLPGQGDRPGTVPLRPQPGAPASAQPQGHGQGAGPVQGPGQEP
ncbi:hypothetical protein HCC61_26115 [Streptomyces sp. HNM0575]|uniref:hypothetical protein n=1 Tax=Streptomyces sp. HNM0575 TaxID=2716338 RepID=UPI00145D4064|nr:hypothetical protein [Streptomyces sp. HNM0575]NLU76082.1 hypothetical protein [Streptomyces sp. HNM0575]